jgi:UDP-N-acetylenolpyruvoylglucosamine reductase
VVVAADVEKISHLNPESRDICIMTILENELMSKHTTFKIGGPCKFFVICEDFSAESFADLSVNFPAEFSRKNEIAEYISNGKYKIIGNGSNLLVPDNGYDGVVVKLSKNLVQLNAGNDGVSTLSGGDDGVNTLSRGDNGVNTLSGGNCGKNTLFGGNDGVNTSSGRNCINSTLSGGDCGKNTLSEGNCGKNTITVSSDKMLIDVCRFARDNGLSGLEWAYGIPGTVGGAVYMNAGAYGGEMKDVVFSVNGKTNFTFGYRHSSFMGSGEVIKTAEIRLKRGDKEEINSKMKLFMQRRKEKQPLEYPSGGSFFKRPCTEPGKEVYAAKLIEECGLKGHSVGGAQVSEKHAGFIINRGGATFADVIHLAEIVQNHVLTTTGYRLEIEPEILK